MEKPFGTDLASAVALNDFRARNIRGIPDLPYRPLSGQGGGPEHLGVPLRQRSVRADLEPQLHRPHPDRHSRSPRSGSAGELLRGDWRLQGHGRDPPVPGDGVRGDGAADGPRAMCHQRRKEQGVPVDAAGQAFKCGARPVRRVPRRGRRGKGFRHRDVHRPQGRHRQLALGRRADLSPHRQEDGRGHPHHLDRIQRGSPEHVPAGVGGRDPGPRSPHVRSR